MDWDKVTIIDLEASVSPEIMARGQEYYQTGHILRVCCYDRIIAGEVAGTGGSYRVRLTLENAKIDGVCSCPYPGFCKHMVAITLAWLEKSIDFPKLESSLQEVINDPEILSKTFIQLVEKDPLNFLDLTAKTMPEETFINSRGIINLIRNTFKGPLLTPEQIEARWEKIKQIEALVNKSFAKQEQGAVELLGALLKGIADSYRDYPEKTLEKVFNELLSQTKALEMGWTEEEIVCFAESLWNIYFDNSLWEVLESVRPVLVSLFPLIPEWFLKNLANIEWKSLERIKLVLVYEFLILAAKKGPVGEEYLKKAIEVLNETSEGQLWLIDRLMEEDPNRAYTLAKERLRNCSGENKQAFRERLIKIHLRRGENKQAAALSFVQFQEEPNLQEYLRLKDILAGWPIEFENYLNKMDKLIDGQGLDILSARIAFDRENWTKLEEKIGEISPDQAFLKELAKLIMVGNNRFAPGRVYQAIISRLLVGGRINWETSLGLIVIYKKLCLKNSCNEEWKEFSVVLKTEYGADQKFLRKFGAVLAG